MKRYNLSEKQEALLSYIIKRLGFNNEEFLITYLEELQKMLPYFRNFRAIYPKENEIVDENSPPKTYFYFDGEKWLPTKYSIIDYLIDEYSLKKNKTTKSKENIERNEKLVSATDLSAFSFCPASFSIINSFKVETNILAERGTSLHKTNRLIKKEKIYKERMEDDGGNIIKEDGESIIVNNEYLKNDENEEFFNDIQSSKLIYSGHDEVDVKYFKNNNGNFVGQPDYIFQRLDGQKFIVEEKFRLEKLDANQSFYNNHEIQLKSYLYGLHQVNANYGYLVYWYYDYYNGFFNMNSCKVKKIIKSNYTKEYLNNLYKIIISLKTSSEINFDIQSLSPNKCAKCVVSRYCGHKTGRYNTLTFPYSLKYHNIWRAIYPEILKKNYDNEILNNEVDNA